MAEAPAQAPTESSTELMYFTPNEVLGAIARNLQETLGYMMQDPRGVDPMVISAYLHRAFEWTQKLPVPQAAAGVPPNGGGKSAEEGKRAN